MLKQKYTTVTQLHKKNNKDIIEYFENASVYFCKLQRIAFHRFKNENRTGNITKYKKFRQDFMKEHSISRRTADSILRDIQGKMKALEELKKYSSGELVGKVTHKQSGKQSSAYVIVSELVDLKNLDSYLTKVEYRKLKGYRNRLGFLKGKVQEFETVKGVLRLTFEQEKAETIFD